ncbi:MAG: STAS/SEC14 domain-containing protein [bacterium]|nr:STAS/SEC14 domain-containing protein [bacterium]
MKSTWLKHNGARIQYADYSGFHSDLEALKAEVEYASGETLKEPPYSVLSLVNVTDTMGTQEIVEYLKNAAVRTKPYIKKMAVVGVPGYKKILLRAVIAFTGQDIKPFDTLDEAKEWLAQ